MPSDIALKELDRRNT